MNDELKDAAFILWLNYGSEGWKPYPYPSAEELAGTIEAGTSSPFVVTGPAMTIAMRINERKL